MFIYILTFDGIPAGADKDTGSGGKRPLMMRTPNGYKCLTCNRVFSQKGWHDAQFLLYCKLLAHQHIVTLQGSSCVVNKSMGVTLLSCVRKPFSSLS